MGNEQSTNKRQPNWKIFKVVSLTEGRSYGRLVLDDYVDYENGKRKFIDFKKNFLENAWGWEGPYVGSYVRIDLNKTKLYPIAHDFKRSEDDVMQEVVKRTDSNGNTLETLANLSDIGDMLEERQRFYASIEQSSYATNHAWTKQTSWDMPPGWK